MIKVHELSDPNSCLNRAQSDEPLFVLRANDELAPEVVEFWADHRVASRGVSDPKAVEALECAKAMREWKRKQQTLLRVAGLAPDQEKVPGLVVEPQMLSGCVVRAQQQLDAVAQLIDDEAPTIIVHPDGSVEGDVNGVLSKLRELPTEGSY